MKSTITQTLLITLLLTSCSLDHRAADSRNEKGEEKAFPSWFYCSNGSCQKVLEGVRVEYELNGINGVNFVRFAEEVDSDLTVDGDKVFGIGVQDGKTGKWAFLEREILGSNFWVWRMISSKVSIGTRSFFFKQLNELVFKNEFFFKVGSAASEAGQFFLRFICKSRNVIPQFIGIVLKEIVLENDGNLKQQFTIYRMAFEHVVNAWTCLIEVAGKLAYGKALLLNTFSDLLPNMNFSPHKILTVKVIEPNGSYRGHRSILYSL